MSFDISRILESKRALRKRLAARPVAEKLRMLDALRERTLALRSASVSRPQRVPDLLSPKIGRQELRKEA